MNLQNIVIDFTESKVSTMFEDKHYDVDIIDNILPVKNAFETAYNLVFVKTVIQLSEDQHMCKPRVLCINDKEEVSFVTIIDIARNHTVLFLQLKSIRELVEEEVSKQLITE